MTFDKYDGACVCVLLVQIDLEQTYKDNYTKMADRCVVKKVWDSLSSASKPFLAVEE